MSLLDKSDDLPSWAQEEMENAHARIMQLEKDLKSVKQSAWSHAQNAANFNIEKCRANARVRKLEKENADLKQQLNDISTNDANFLSKLKNSLKSSKDIVLTKDHVYQTYEGKKIVFTGWNVLDQPMFQPLGKPSREDKFIMTDPNWRDEIKRDLGEFEWTEHYGMDYKSP